MNSHPDWYPKPDTELKERTIQESVRLFKQQSCSGTHVTFTPVWISQWKPFAAGMAACVALMMVFLHGMTPPAVSGRMNMAANLQLLHEMKEVFGDRLDAIVEDGNNIQPVVSHGPSFTDAQPVIITLKQGSKTMTVISFSGNTVTLNVGQKSVTLSPIATSDGKVIVEGKDFLWSHGTLTGNGSLSIDAKPLGATL